MSATSASDLGPADRSITTTDVVVDHRTDAGTVRALECGPLEIAGGATVAIMGPSGCGKSTLLGLLAGLAVPTRGRITVGAVVVSELGERSRTRFRREALGIVYQSDNLLPHLTVEENVALQLSIAGTGPTDSSRAPALLDRLGLGSLRDRLPDQLSGGQRQRVAVARAVVHEPALLFADEPTGALDPENARGVIELLTEVNRRIGATLVVVTHDPVIAAHLDRTVQLRRPDRARGTGP